MKEIKLSKGGVTLVDDEDYEELNKYSWYSVKKYKNGTFYVHRSNHPNTPRMVPMHRQVLGITDKNIDVDHKDHNGLNNQKSNLRACSRKDNVRNKTSQVGSSSIYLGVYWDKRKKRWIAGIAPDGKRIYLGRHKNEVDAGRAYDKAAKEHYGEFANLNFKED